mmetsp:Transcript_80749/g.234194  ORF Transcript_80749/g.234194 Transcript_80749/m.234194 type:complete len:350 (+) Transcript_80749:2-1051(+)
MSVILLRVQPAHMPQADLIAASHEAEAAIRASTVAPATLELTLKASIEALKSQRSFAAIAGAVQEEVARVCDGHWVCIVGVESQLGLWLSASVATMLMVSFGELQLVLVKASGPTVSQTEIIADSRGADPDIRSSTAMTEELQQRVVVRARRALDEYTSFGEVAKAVRTELQEAAGGSGVWQCVVGVDAHVGFSVLSAHGAFCSAAFGDVVVMVFKAPMDPQRDILDAAMAQQPIIRKSTIPDTAQRRAIDSITAALREHADFTAVAQAVREEMQSVVGGIWQCIVGLESVVGYHVSFANRAFLHIACGDLRIVLFKAFVEQGTDVVAAVKEEEADVKRSTRTPDDIQP